MPKALRTSRVSAPRTPMIAGSFLDERVLQVIAGRARVRVELHKYAEDYPTHLDIAGDAFVEGAVLSNGGATFTVADPRGIRALGEALLQLADEAEAAGVLA